MIVSHNPNRLSSRRVQACVLLAALIVLPLGAASAQDIGAVWERLQTAVKKGEISQQQAHIMMGALKGSMYKAEKDSPRDEDKIVKMYEEWFQKIGNDLRGAVKAGKITEAQAWEKWRHVKEEQIAGKLKASVKAGDLSEERAMVLWRSIEKGEREHKEPRGDDRSEREKADAHVREIWGKLQQAVKEGKMSQEDAHRKMGAVKKEIYGRLERHEKDHKQHERGDKDKHRGHHRGRGRHDRRGGEHKSPRRESIETHYNKLGVDNETVGKIRGALKERGLKDKQIEPALGGILRTIHEMRTEGDRYEMDPRLSGYLRKEHRLDDDQVKMVQGLAGRILHGLNKNRGEDRDEKPNEEEGLRPVPKADAQRIGAMLANLANNFRRPQVRIGADPSKSVGVIVPEHGGILLIPQRGMREDRPSDMAAKNGGPLGMFFSSPRLLPKVDGKLVRPEDLHSVVIVKKGGEKERVNCLLLSVKKLSDEDYRLYGFGRGDKPIIDVKITDGDGPDTMPMAMEIDGDEVVITIYGKYQARFPGGVAE